MEQYTYKCPLCGYVHIVPSYWVSYDPPATLSQPHFQNGEMCEAELVLAAEETAG